MADDAKPRGDGACRIQFAAMALAIIDAQRVDGVAALTRKRRDNH